MDIGEPQKTHIITPLKEPVPQWIPQREPISIPQEQPAFAEPVLIPEKVQP